ncbi:MAG: hypothetical protein DRN68_01445 [Thaumarchaeota archaeon]|nr:MAG: hypothetical protein DRN68_01445 [Nitrososphaerota archaeon]
MKCEGQGGGNLGWDFPFFWPRGIEMTFRDVLTVSAWLRYRLFVHRMRQNKVRYAVLGSVFLILALSGSSLFGALFYQVQGLLYTENPALFREVVHLFCLVIFLGWVLLSLFWGMCSPDIPHISRMAQFPISFKRLYEASVLSGLPDYWIAIFGPAFGWLVVSLRPTMLMAFLSVFSVALFVGATYLLVYVLNLWLGVSLKFPSYRKLLSVISIAILLVLSAVAAGHLHVIAGPLLKFRLSRYSIFTPPGLLAELLLGIKGERFLSSIGCGLGLLGYLGMSLWAGYHLTRWRVFERSSVPRRDARYKSNRFERLCKLFEIFIPSHYLPILAKDLLYFTRNPRMKLLLVLAAVWTLIFPGIHTAAGAAITPKSLLWFLWYTLVIICNFWDNIFGLESKGMANNYLLPIGKKQILVGKNLAMWLLRWASICPGLSWILYLCWKGGIWWEGISMVIVLFYFMISLALLGNIISLRFPVPLKFGEITGPYTIVPGAIVTFIFGLLGAVVPLAADVYFFHYLYPRPKIMASTLAVLCVLMLALYRLFLPRAERIFDERKEEILSEFRAPML